MKNSWAEIKEEEEEEESKQIKHLDEKPDVFKE